MSVEKLVVILVIAAIVIGPERLPALATWIAKTVGKARTMFDGAKSRIGEEMGAADLDLSDLDPRRYDPRRIIHDAWDGGSATGSAAVSFPTAQDLGDHDSATSIVHREQIRRAEQHVRLVGRVCAPFDEQAT